MTDEIVKVCKVHGELTIDGIYLYAKRNEKTCKLCHKFSASKWISKNSETIKRYTINNREKHREACKKYYLRNKEKVLNKNRYYYDNNKEIVSLRYKNWAKKNKDKINKYGKKYRDNLVDAYLKWVICASSSLSRHEIPFDLILLKRAEISIKRKLRKNNDQKRA